MGRIFSFLIWVYQKSLSPLLGDCCRFYPSCSEYGRLCLEKYRLHSALYKISLRLCRCHPFHAGGIDLP